jgi:hypothetical protein
MLKNKNRYSTVFSGLAILLFTSLAGCDNFTTLNTPKDTLNANDLTTSNLGKLFAKAEYAGYLSRYQVSENLFSDLYAQYFATDASYFTTDQFQFKASWENSTWTAFYSGASPQLKLLLDYTSKHKMTVANAVAKIWKVVMYGRITDLFGPIILSNFGNSKSSVAYDSQKSVYSSFFKLLDEAVAVLKNSSKGVVFSNSDLIYGGNVAQWLRFANSLRLRLAIRIVYADPVMAKKQAEKAMQAPGGVIENNSDNARLFTTTGAQPATRNTLALVVGFSNHGEFRISSALLSYLEGYQDPRLSAYANQAVKGGGYHGLRNGISVSTRSALQTDKFSTVATRFFPVGEGGSNIPWPVMTASEVYFLRAEGALRGWGDMGGTAEQLYDEGIKLSLEDQTSASASEINAYIKSVNKPVALNDQWNSPPVSNIPVKFEYGASFETNLDQIITQKWLSFYPNGLEAYNDRRRTGYPKLYPIIQSLNPNIPNDGIVRRMGFVTSEYDNNHEAVENAIKLLQTHKDNHETRVWWDAKGLH